MIITDVYIDTNDLTTNYVVTYKDKVYVLEENVLKSLWFEIDNGQPRRISTDKGLYDELYAAFEKAEQQYKRKIKLERIFLMQDKKQTIRDEDDVTGDYSCGNCGWWGYVSDCDFEPLDEDKPEGDGFFACPTCGSSRVGEITEEDFLYYNALYGKKWHGKEM